MPLLEVEGEQKPQWPRGTHVHAHSLWLLHLPRPRCSTFLIFLLIKKKNIKSSEQTNIQPSPGLCFHRTLKEKMVFMTTGDARMEEGRFRMKEGDAHRQQVFHLPSFCTHHTKLHIVKHLYPCTSTPCWLELCFPGTLKADRQEPHLLLTGSAEKYLLATGAPTAPHTLALSSAL